MRIVWAGAGVAAFMAVAGIGSTQIDVERTLDAKLVDFSAESTMFTHSGVYTTDVTIDDGMGVKTLNADHAVSAVNSKFLEEDVGTGRGYYDKKDIPLEPGQTYRFVMKERLSDRIGLTQAAPKVTAIFQPG